MIRLLTLLAAVAVPAFAQNAEIQKELIRRQQQSDAFVLQLRQSQESLKVSPPKRPELESQQLSERQRLENVSEKQLVEVKPDTPQELRPLERQRADEDLVPLRTPKTDKAD